jgi:hypothetical protein
MMQIHELERTETRALAALRCVDATTRVAIDAPLDVAVARSTVRRNRSGLYVIASAAALPGHDAAFQAPPTEPPVGSVSLRAVLRDPSGHYLSRSASITLPRDPDPALGALPASLFQPIDVALYCSSAAATGVNWSVLRVSVSRANTGEALGSVLLRVLQGGQVLARGMTDWRGEALVPVAGVPVTTWSDDPAAVVIHAIQAQLEVTVDLAALQATAPEDVRNGKVPADRPPADPDLLEAGSGAGFHRQRVDVELSAGASQSHAFALVLP